MGRLQNISELDSTSSSCSWPLSSIMKIKKEEDAPQEVTSCWVCTRDGVETSEFYCDVQYCSPQCRDLHHPPDHEEPWPIITKYKPGVGRLLVAARDIDQGELIFTEECF